MNDSSALAEPLIANARREAICRLLGESYDPARWADWRWQMRHRLTKPEQFAKLLKLTPAERRGLAVTQGKFAMAVTPHFAELIDPKSWLEADDTVLTISPTAASNSALLGSSPFSSR